MARREADLSRLSVHDLRLLRDRIDCEIESRREAGDSALRLRGGLVERDGPRYRNPNNSAETWSGKGKRPAWVDAVLAEGFPLRDLEIVDDRPVESGPEGPRTPSR